MSFTSPFSELSGHACLINNYFFWVETRTVYIFAFRMTFVNIFSFNFIEADILPNSDF